jgi:glycosyltransferase involved in cell wall biosynthesis
MSDTAPQISVIIPHLNQPQMLARCLASLEAQNGAPPFEIIVVDNGSAHLPQAICEDAGAQLLREPAPGPGLARNLGVSAAKAEILAFIDADCLAGPGWLAAITARFEDPAAQVLGGDVRIACVDPNKLTVLEAYESVYAYRMEEYIRKQGFTGTGNLALRRAVFDATGPFGGIDIAEDRDWGQRAAARGFPTEYEPAMKVYHPARACFADLYKKWDRHTAHDFARISPGPGGRISWLARGLAVAGSPAVEIFRIAGTDRLPGPGARLRAFAGLLHIRLYRAWRMLHLGFGADPSGLSGSWNRNQVEPEHPAD